MERGKWVPPKAVEPPPEPEAIPTFHAFAEAWWTQHKGQVTGGTLPDYRWRLEQHLIPYFGPLPLDAISIDAVDRYKAGKLEGVVYDDGRDTGERVKPLSPRSINMTLVLLAQILENAVERELIGRNPARGKKRRVPQKAPDRPYLDAARQIQALLDAAGELDGEAHERRRHVERRAMLAVLVFAGLRISELCALRWRDVDLATGWLSVADSKTAAGVRKVKIRGALRDGLLALRGRHQDDPQDAYVFATSEGKRISPDNFRNRVLGRPAEGEKDGTGAVGRANLRLEKAAHPPLPAGLTPHSLRRTFCSLLYALGEDPGVVMDEMGHTDEGLALRVYRQAMRRDESEKVALRALLDGTHGGVSRCPRRPLKRQTVADEPKVTTRRLSSGRPPNEKTARLAGGS